MSIFKKVAKFASKSVKAVSGVVAKARPVLAPVYDVVIPTPVKKALKTAATVASTAEKIHDAIDARNGVKKMPDMVQLEEQAQRFVEAVGNCESAKGLDLLGYVFEAGDALNDMRNAVKDEPVETWSPQLRQLLDRYIGSEDTAIIGDGPNVKIRINVPFLGTEMVSDLLLIAMEKAITGQR